METSGRIDLDCQMSRKPNFTIVAPMVARFDAISNSVRKTFEIVARSDLWKARILTFKSDFPDLPATIVNDASDVIRAPEFLNADVLYYSFGIYNPLFDCMLLGNGRASQIARFHNI